MFLGEPPRTQFELNFRLAGFPIRVTPWFWLATLLLGLGPTDNGAPDLLLPWVLAVFASILVHELGHAVAFRAQRISSHIVLYHFGGLAIPDGSAATSGGRDPRSRMIIAFAGPAAQLTTATALMALLTLCRREVPLVGFVANLLPLPVGLPALEPYSLRLFVVFYLYVSIYWALLNLLPVYPLDGGQIARELLLTVNRGDAIKQSLILSVVVGGLLAVWGFWENQLYLGILFGMLAYSSYSVLQAYAGHGGGFGRRW